MTTTNLRPCPLCGTTENVAQYSGKPYKGSRQVYCNKCGLQWFTNTDGTFDHWNTRPIEDGLRAEIEALQKELGELKEQYRWHSLEKDGLPELDQDVEIINMRTMEMQAGHFFDYEEGNPTAKDIMFDDHNDTTFALDELPKKYQWRYLNAPKGGE